MSVPGSREALRLFKAEYEFDAFVKEAGAKVEQLAERNSRFLELDGLYTFSRDELPKTEGRSPYALFAVRFGWRFVHPAQEGVALARENSASLTYVLKVATGTVTVALYPADSRSGDIKEHCIRVATGQFTANELMARLAQDISDLVAYGYVTAFAGAPTFGERLRVSWLRMTRDKV
jgi:hypothetical protein